MSNLPGGPGGVSSTFISPGFGVIIGLSCLCASLSLFVLFRLVLIYRERQKFLSYEYAFVFLQVTNLASQAVVIDFLTSGHSNGNFLFGVLQLMGSVNTMVFMIVNTKTLAIFSVLDPMVCHRSTRTIRVTAVVLFLIAFCCGIVTISNPLAVGSQLPSGTAVLCFFSMCACCFDNFQTMYLYRLIKRTGKKGMQAKMVCSCQYLRKGFINNFVLCLFDCTALILNIFFLYGAFTLTSFSPELIAASVVLSSVHSPMAVINFYVLKKSAVSLLKGYNKGQVAKKDLPPAVQGAMEKEKVGLVSNMAKENDGLVSNMEKKDSLPTYSNATPHARPSVEGESPNANASVVAQRSFMLDTVKIQ